MSRIRSIKPEFFRHEGLQDLEIAHPGSYVMLVYAGLWTLSDREGRFLWKPKTLKLDVLPFLEFDMAETLSLLIDAGCVTRYEVEGSVYGQVNNWDRHQIAGRDEPPSEIPAPDGIFVPYFRPLTQTQRFKVYERDRWECAYCGRDMAHERRAACLDHVVPYCQGGTNRAENLVTSCKKCNAAKGGRTPSEAGMTWPCDLGERVVNGQLEAVNGYVNTPLTGGLALPDKERERERERYIGKGRECEGNHRENAPGGEEPLFDDDGTIPEPPDPSKDNPLLTPDWQDTPPPTSKKRKSRLDQMPPVPPGFEDAVEKWNRYRKASHKPLYVPDTWAAKFAEYEGRAADFARDVAYSIGQGYVGIYPPKESSNGHAGKKSEFVPFDEMVKGRNG